MLNKLKWLFFRRFQLINTLSGLTIHWTSYIDPQSTLSGYNRIGRRCRINDSTVGSCTYISADTKINRTKIGKFCSIGQECIIGGVARHPTDWLSTHPAFFSTKSQANITFATIDQFEEQGTVEIGNDVWIGVRALVFDGCRIGDGAIVAAGAVVTKDVPPYAIYGGVPAKLIRYRFSDDVILALLKAEWWNYDLDEIRRLKGRPPFIDELGLLKIMN